MQDEGLVTKEDRLPWTANPAASEGNSMHSEIFMGGVQGIYAVTAARLEA